MIRNAPPSRKGRWRGSWVVALRTLRGVVFLEDTHRRIARGSAAGILCSTLPIVGQTFLAMIFARVVGANVFASIPWSWLSNPLTTLPIWYGGYCVGAWLLPGTEQALTYADLAALSERFNHSSWSDGLSLTLNLLSGVLGQLWLGCTLLGLLLAVPGYFLVHAAVVALQARRATRQAAWRR